MSECWEIQQLWGNILRHYLFFELSETNCFWFKIKCPSKVSWGIPKTLYYSLIYGNCLGNVVMGMEKCGKMCENV